MALKALVLRSKADAKKAELEALAAKDAELQAREAELSASIEEMTAETTQEDRETVERAVEDFEAEKKAHEEAKAELEREIGEIENELAAEESEQDTETKTPEAVEAPEEKREDAKTMRDHYESRAIAFGKMSTAEQAAFCAREDVREYLDGIKENMRAAKGGQARAITNVGLTVPTVMLGLIRENVLRYSKLYGHVTVSRVNGEARVLIAGGIPEAVWTECCANLNELTMSFYQEAFGCWRLGGFFTVCNANLEDSDIDLAAEILTTLGQSIGYTDDKTIIYGTGSGMPLGIVPRLAQTSQPAGYPATARPWVDLHTSNVKTIAATTGLALFQQLALAAAAAKGSYSRGEKVWAMNETTYSYLVAQAMSFDAAGAIASGVNGTMPVIGGIIEVLPASIIPDNNIVMGYMDLYRMIERAGERYASSEHVLFLADQTVFKGVVRWDGKPIIPEAFVLIGINGTSPTTSATFAADGANTPASIWLPATASVAVGGKITLAPVIQPYGVETALTWVSGTEAKATVNGGEVTGVATGSSVITVTTANGLTAQCTVTVTAS